VSDLLAYENHVSEKLGNGNIIDYKVINGTYYHEQTDDLVVSVLERERRYDERIRIYYGDTKTGQSWLDEHDIMGTIGRSTGRISIPLLIHNSRSNGGGGILDHCIVKIVGTRTNTVLYQHPNFRIGDFEIVKKDNDGYPFMVCIDGSNHANFKTMEKAERWVAFMKGETNRK
jgi:hypothetical protein